MEIPASHFIPHHSFTIASEHEMVSVFRPRDQKKLVLLTGLRFPLRDDTYFHWKEPSGVYTYLIFKRPNWDAPRGVAFKRSHVSGEPIGGLCNWCHSYGTSEDIGLLTVKMDAEVSLSYFLCHDLRCIDKIEEAAGLAGKNPDRLIQRLYFRMEKLFEGLSQYRLDE